MYPASPACEIDSVVPWSVNPITQAPPAEIDAFPFVDVYGASNEGNSNRATVLPFPVNQQFRRP